MPSLRADFLGGSRISPRPPPVLCSSIHLAPSFSTSLRAVRICRLRVQLGARFSSLVNSSGTLRPDCVLSLVAERGSPSPTTARQPAVSQPERSAMRVAMEAGDLRVPEIPLAPGEDDLDSNKNSQHAAHRRPFLVILFASSMTSSLPIDRIGRRYEKGGCQVT
ncbi:hypothetical protein NECAME_00397 [Necator americanus]|uniref:Uncharacterized protein n=1 Tax=Necator americanus TaxID=51031 RepID=W2TCU8_NECAM|nr:hypothetical protein NECAME_00397 [Necator americanus]ETN79021.1 hypothetical protein NECAME_00397 [Necator americanus]